MHDITGTDAQWATNPEQAAQQQLSKAEYAAYLTIPAPDRRAYATARTVGASHNTAMGAAGRALARRMNSR